jgi:hypothetical protein
MPPETQRGILVKQSLFEIQNNEPCIWIFYYSFHQYIIQVNMLWCKTWIYNIEKQDMPYFLQTKNGIF